MKKIGIVLLFWGCMQGVHAQQLSVPRVDKMPNLPAPYVMRDWKSVTMAYDRLVFNLNKSGNGFPLVRFNSSGTNYPEVRSIFLDTYVGSGAHGNQAEAINIMPAVIGASLVGIDKSMQNEENWVLPLKDFFNGKNGQNVYLNNYNAASGHDWWYDLMPNIYFYQLRSLYPGIDAEFDRQFTVVADRWLNAVRQLGGGVQPWRVPNMNYRAFNLMTGKPLTTGVKEPESAGSIAWLLYQAYTQTGERKYFEGAQQALEFLSGQTANPSYELQLPYGTLIAARMNAEQGCNYPLDKMMNWCFDRGSLRGWGVIVGKWGGYDVSGLIGEANDGGNDYAFIMNGFQQAAALAPLVKYDKRYARAIGKWLLNLSNASRLMYANALPAEWQETQSHAWSSQHDSEACIPYESMKEKWNGKSPFMMGDATGGGWATTNLSLYSGSSVGYLAALIETTNIEGILQIDVNKTDFYASPSYPTYLYYNPHAESKTVEVRLPSMEAVDLYDAVSESVVASSVSGSCSITVPADGVTLITLIPAESRRVAEGRVLKVADRVIDYHYQYNYATLLRAKTMVTEKGMLVSGEQTKLTVYADNIPSGATVLYEWTVNGEKLNDTYGRNEIIWTAPATAGTYRIKAVGVARNQQISDSIVVEVLSEIYDKPFISALNISAPFPLPAGAKIEATAFLDNVSPDMTTRWTVDGGALQTLSDVKQSWQLPEQSGVYTITCTASNRFGESVRSLDVLVKEAKDAGIAPMLYYSFNGNTENQANEGAYSMIRSGCMFAEDAKGRASSALRFASLSDEAYVENRADLNFQDALFIGCWISVDARSGREQFLISHGSWEERFKLSLSPDGTMRWTVNTSNGIKDLDYRIPLETGRYYHVGVAYTGYSMEIYVDGVFHAFQKHNGTMGQTTNDLTLAAKSRTEKEYNFLGKIDELRLYHGVLSVSEICKLPDTWNLVTSIDRLPASAQQLTYYLDGSTLRLCVAEESVVSASLFNLQGKLVASASYLSGSKEEVLALPALPASVYVLKVNLSGGGVCTGKVVIK